MNRNYKISDKNKNLKKNISKNNNNMMIYSNFII